MSLRFATHITATLALLSLTLLFAGSTSADDRDLLRESGGEPYVFIVFDTSSSMNWSTPCTQAQYDAGECNLICPTGDCFVPMNGDDPNSKFYQAKQAVFEVIQSTPNIRYGFATFNQDGLQVRHKHWLYEVAERKPDGSLNGLVLRSGTRFPSPGAQEVFGPPWSCDEINGDPNNAEGEFKEAGCWAESTQITRLDEPLELQRAHRLPKIGQSWGRYRDEFNLSALDNSDGDLGWSTNPWVLNDVADTSTAGGEVRIEVVDGDTQITLRDQNTSQAGPGIIREVDMTPWIHLMRPEGNDPLDWNRLFAPWVELSFDYKAVASSGDKMFVLYCHPGQDDCSNNACPIGNTLWHKIGELEGGTSGHKSYNISQFPLGADFYADTVKLCIRKSTGFSSNGEFLAVDNVEVTAGVSMYLRDPADGTRYKFNYRALDTLPDGTTNAYGNEPFAAEIEAYICDNDVQRCDSTLYTRDIVYYDWPTVRFSDQTGVDPVSGETIWTTRFDKVRPEFISWDMEPNISPPQNGFFSGRRAASIVTDVVDGDEETNGTKTFQSCNGWDPNDDDSFDDLLGDGDLILRYDTFEEKFFDLDEDAATGVAGKEFLVSKGDVLPFDWTDNHKTEIMERLAPTIVDGDPPDFSIARYLENERVGNELGLRPKDVNRNRLPIFADGQTPLGATIEDFREWYEGCPSGNCPKNTGWRDLAAKFDPDFNCRKKFLIVITDGDESCGGGNSACQGTAGLLAQSSVRTFVLAFGNPGGGNTLTCMANNGGTGEPIFANNKAELVDALQALFGEIRVAARSFAAASVPTVQNETSDKLFISNFIPLRNRSKWLGEINAFRKPLPLKDDDTPDTTRLCDDSSTGLVRQSGCFLWDAGEILLGQAPSPDYIANNSGDLKIGPGINQRRIFYSAERLSDAVPSTLRVFDRSTDAGLGSSTEHDFWDGLGLGFTIGDLTSESAARDQANSIVRESLVIKSAMVPSESDPDVNVDEEFVLGDIFHADPLVTASPNNLIYFREDLNGYREFTRKHFWRRKMLVVAANDGQVHFFDSGIRTTVIEPTSGEVLERFTDGTGTELFSYTPRLVMPLVTHQATNSKHVYSLDGNLATGDVYIDPRHGGNNVLPQDRGWRSIIVAGLREGGDIFESGNRPPGFVSGYYALDVTQPDELEPPPASDPNAPWIPQGEGDILPTCMNLRPSGDSYVLDDGGANNSVPPAGQCKTPAGTDHFFPAELWIFKDEVRAFSGSPLSFPMDEDDANGDGVPDGNGFRDLGDTWSTPIIGRIQVCAPGGGDCAPGGADLEDRYVAIFGGGIDPVAPLSSQQGAFLYMLDVETGKAIYKQPLRGGVAASPTVLDIDRNGYFDVIYVATTGGFLYKIDLQALDSNGEIPGFTDVRIDDSRLLGSPLGAGVGFDIQRIEDPAWAPFAIFNTEGKPLFQTPTVFLVPDLDQFALAFGTGNRHNLWDFDGTPARFYTIVDENFTPTTPGLPRTEGYAGYTKIAFDSQTVNGNLLSDAGGPRGWIIELGNDERVINQAFVVVGVVIFSSFAPQEDLADEINTAACARSGVSRIFVVEADSANAFADLDSASGDTVERFITVGDFTTSPYVDQTSTKNPENEFDTGDGVNDDEEGRNRNTENILNAAQEALQESIRKSLMRFFPEGCRFNKSYSMTINASRSDTGHVRYATIPIAMCPVDWKEE